MGILLDRYNLTQVNEAYLLDFRRFHAGFMEQLCHLILLALEETGYIFEDNVHEDHDQIFLIFLLFLQHRKDRLSHDKREYLGATTAVVNYRSKLILFYGLKIYIFSQEKALPHFRKESSLVLPVACRLLHNFGIKAALIEVSCTLIN